MTSYKLSPKSGTGIRQASRKSSQPGRNDTDFYSLNGHIQELEGSSNGVEVLFWKVASEHLPSVWHQCEIQQSIVHNREIQMPAGGCGPCTVRQQIQEVMFALTGNPCYPNPELVAKYGHLKIGDTFPLTNTAGVDARVTMKIDASIAADALKKFLGQLALVKDDETKKNKGEKQCGH